MVDLIKELTNKLSMTWCDWAKVNNYIYAWRECVFVLKQWWSLVEKAIRGPNTHDACTCSEYMYQLTGHWIRNRLVCSNLTVVE